MVRRDPGPPPGVATTTHRHRVAFYETDAMGIVHHANYVKYLELARVRWMDEHHRPYSTYVERGLHFAVTRVDVDYHQSARFDEEVAVTTWMAWCRGASLRMDYVLTGPAGVLVTGGTEHAVVDEEGRVRRIPKEDRQVLIGLAASAS